MPIFGRNALGSQPSLLHRLYHIFRQRTLLKIYQILLQMLDTTCANNDRIIEFLLYERMMLDPPQGYLRNGQAMLVGNWLDDVQCIKVTIIPL